MVFDAHAFCRNETNADPELLDNYVVHGTNEAWFRLWGGMYQSETPLLINKNQAIYTDSTSQVERFATRITRQDGDTRGGDPLGMETVTTNISFDKFMGGVKRCDATSGAITINLPSATSAVDYNPVAGEQWIFKKVDASANTVTITAAGAFSNFEGAASVILASQWDAARLMWDGSTWLSV